MRIGIDIDDTICDSIENMLPYICKFYDLNYEDEKIKHMPYSYYHNFPNYRDFAINHYETVMPMAKLKNKADYFINEIKKLGHEIIFVTARDSLGFKNPDKVSKDYLDKYKICYDKIITRSSDKGSICFNEKIDIFIDDSPQNCLNVLKKNNNIIVYLFDNEFNKFENSLIRVYDWEDIYNRILSLSNN